jgi:hypothetical protein
MAESWTCVRCNKVVADPAEAVWIAKKATTEYLQICTECELIIWDVPIKLVFHWGIPTWVESTIRTKRILSNLQLWFNHRSPCVIHYVSREEADTVAWQSNWVARDRWDEKARGSFSYRGYCDWGTIVVLVDSVGIETPESLEWITYHELGHHECQRIAKMVDQACSVTNKNNGLIEYNWQDDDAHESDAEEQHVNRMATAFMGGREYARPWWRKRVDAWKAGESVLPDCYAKQV